MHGLLGQEINRTLISGEHQVARGSRSTAVRIVPDHSLVGFVDILNRDDFDIAVMLCAPQKSSLSWVSGMPLNRR